MSDVFDRLLVRPSPEAVLAALVEAVAASASSVLPAQRDFARTYLRTLEQVPEGQRQWEAEC